jgi:error-prone DNA polymerase
LTQTSETVSPPGKPRAQARPDRSGCANLIVRQATWERYAQVARRSPAWVAHGTLERKDAVVHVLVGWLEDLSAKLGALHTKSRDFR